MLTAAAPKGSITATAIESMSDPMAMTVTANTAATAALASSRRNGLAGIVLFIVPPPVGAFYARSPRATSQACAFSPGFAGNASRSEQQVPGGDERPYRYGARA